MASHNPHILSDKEKAFIANILEGQAPSTAALRAGYTHGNLKHLVQRLAIRWLETAKTKG